MSNKSTTLKINWSLIIALSIISLIRPLMSMLGISEAIGKPITSIIATIIISIIWIVTVVIKRDSQPILTLLFTGIGYGVLAIIMSGIFSPILTGNLQGPLTHSF
ncbi:hypothetical protein J2Z40_001510 [Cytobacillus eiseniae]|uniref:Uncharacterized protein n=1 Tax=Cytobacillus eiseniae TaxID=762947 RepID=A0ABS4RDH7_9BACI|nr:hypothetical protein [Cytobacillus eiseniae]MBP2240950.1 hypothetical protein [Cytobacillus eiseniae]